MRGVIRKISGFIFLGGIALIVVFGFFPTPTAHAFSPGYLISDFDFFNHRSLSLRGITDFLNSQTGAIKNMTFDTPEGKKTAAEIIYKVANEYKISPKVLIVTLQKEQSLITSTNPTQRALDYAMGYGCPDSGGCSAKAAGFFTQLDFAAWQFRRYSDYPSQYSFRVGETYTFSDLGGTKQSTVKIVNQATANLFNYTPHVYNGNYNFTNLWARWFQVLYPDGTLVRPEGEAGVSLISNGKRYGFYSRVAFVSRGYDFRRVIVMPKEQVIAYDSAGGIDFPNFSIIEDKNGQRYFVDGLEKLPIPSQKIFDQLGFLDQEVLKYADMTKLQRLAIDTLTTGDALQSPETTSYPTGVLLQNSETGAIGYVKNGVMHMLHSKEVLYNQFPNRAWVRVSSQEFNSFKQGSAIKLRDGTLVRSPKYGGGVFIISNGKRRPITSREVFDGLGFKMENVIKTNDRTLELHAPGAPFDSPNQ